MRNKWNGHKSFSLLNVVKVRTYFALDNNYPTNFKGAHLTLIYKVLKSKY